MIHFRFGRIVTRGRRFIAEVDGLRFVAIGSVVLYHLAGYTRDKHMTGASILPGEAWLPQLLSFGHYGVQLFFVLSGFLLAIPFAKWRLSLGSKPSLKAYYLRRLTRLEPPYIVSMLILFAGGFVALGAVAAKALWPNLLASLVYQHNLIYGDGSRIIPPAWSLEVEVQFYLLAPFLAVAFSMRRTIVRRLVLLAAMIGVPLLRSLIFHDAPVANGPSLPDFFEFFVAGFFLADLFLVDWKESPGHHWRWDILSLAAWPLLIALMFWGRLPALMAPTILLAYIGAFRGRLSSWLFSRPLLTGIGGMCYSMYLLHYAVISVTGRVAQHVLVGSSFTARLAIEALFALPAVLVVTGVFFVLVERPCMDPAWPGKLAARIRRPRESQVPLGSQPE